MAAIAIKDLELRQEIDSKVMAMIFGGVNPPALPAGWSVVSKNIQKVNAGQIWIPSKHITGAFENALMFQTLTSITAQYTEWGTG